MRIERKRVGTRVRIFLNKTECRKIGFDILVSKQLAKPEMRLKNVSVRVNQRVQKGWILASEFELACKEFIKPIAIPEGAEFRFNSDKKDGDQIISATFQFYE